jgi:hypothetical protein
MDTRVKPAYDAECVAALCEIPIHEFKQPLRSSFRGAPLGASPESITPVLLFIIRTLAQGVWIPRSPLRVASE